MKASVVAIQLASLALSVTYSMAQVCHSPGNSTPDRSRQGVSVPVAMSGGGVFVPVVMNDGHTYNFLLDSGFEDSVLDPTTVQTLHLASGNAHAETAPGGSVETSSITGVQRRVAGLPLEESTVTSVDLSGFDPLFGIHLDGILGYDFFRQFVVILDYAGQRMTLCDHMSFRPRGGLSPVPLNLQSKQPYIDVELAGTSGKELHASLEIDTGKVDPFSISASFARRSGLMTAQSTFLALKGVSLGGETQGWMSRASYLRFANVSLNKPVMGIVEETSDRAGQLGYGVLKRFTITFDYSRQAAYFEPGPDFDQAYEFDHAGFVLGAGGPKFASLTVFLVFAGTPAAVSGIQQGDEIVAIGKRPAESFSLEEARQYFERAKGEQQLTLRRNGSILTVTLRCRPLV